MKSEKLLEAIGEAREEYVLSALESRNGNGKTAKQPSLKRTWLIAAAIMLSLLLVGCTVIYVLNLEDFRIATSNGYRWYDRDGKRTPKTPTAFDVLSIQGAPGSPNQLAAKEWWAYVTTSELDEDWIGMEKDPLIPDNLYYTYQCKTTEQANKLKEIAKSYGLQLLGVEAVVQRWQAEIYFESMGIPGICRKNTKVQESEGSGIFYPEGDFHYSCKLTLNESGAWQHPIWTTFFYTRKDYFNPEYLEIAMDDFEQWTYATSYGSEVLLARSNLNAIIFADLDDAYIAVLLNDALGRPLDENDFFTNKDIELVADGLNLEMHPNPFDLGAIQPLLDIADAEEAKTQQEPEKEDYSQYAGYQDFLLNYFHSDTLRLWKPFFYYALYDIDGNGVEELLLGRDPETFDFVLTQENGSVAEYLPELNQAQLCNGMQFCGKWGDGYDTQTIVYYDFAPYAPNQDSLISEKVILKYNAAADSWSYSEVPGRLNPISKEKAEEIQSQYDVVPINLHPVLDFPMDDAGTTLGTYERAKTLALGKEAQLSAYRDALEKARSVFPKLQYFAFFDLDKDGIDELLVSDEPDNIRQIYTLFDGAVTDVSIGIGGHYTLCQDGVIQYTDYDWISHEARYFSFYRLNSYCIERIETVEQDQDSSRWYSSSKSDHVTREISENEAQSILSQYGQADLSMRSINEFP